MFIFTLTHTNTNTHKTHLQSPYALGAQCRWAYTPQSYQHILNATYQKKRSDLPFLSLSDHKKEEKRGSIYARAEYNLYLNTVGRQCALEQTIICRQLFAGDVVSARPIASTKVSAGFTNVSSLAVAAFDLVCCSLSVHRFVFVLDISHNTCIETPEIVK